jgi:hypothetical protein
MTAALFLYVKLSPNDWKSEPVAPVSPYKTLGASRDERWSLAAVARSFMSVPQLNEPKIPVWQLAPVDCYFFVGRSRQPQ